MTEETKTPFDKAVGRVLHAVRVKTDDQHSLILEFEEGPDLCVTTEGDCCSESWWADILGASSCYGSEVVAAQALFMEGNYGPVGWVAEDDGRSRHEEDSIYGYAIMTKRGVVTFAFRNSSNGYYGGWAYEVDPFMPEAGETWAWRLIETNDWRA